MTDTPTTCARCGRAMKHTPLTLLYGQMTFECLMKAFGAGSLIVEERLQAGAAHGQLQLSTERPITLTELLAAVVEWAPLAAQGHQKGLSHWTAAQRVAAVHGLELPPLAELRALAECN